jgi:hypothetical protein
MAMESCPDAAVAAPTGVGMSDMLRQATLDGKQREASAD